MGYEADDPRRTEVEEALAYWEQNAMRNQSMVLPKRETIINEDDVTNLKIALGTANTVEELIAQL